MQRIYLDNAAATPVHPRVRKAMTPFFTQHYGNPSALHTEGVQAKQAVQGARGSIAEAIGVHPDEIMFTGSGTESINLAIIGTIKHALAQYDHPPHVITSAIEHPAVRVTLHDLAERNAITLTEVPVTQEGIIQLDALARAFREDTLLVTVMYANNEIGTIQPIRKIAKLVRDHRKRTGGRFPYFHVDACQAVGYLDMHVPRLGADLVTFNGSKIYGPKGIGVLYAARGVSLAPLVYGGGQEHGLRSGTENVPGIVGLAEAVRLVTEKKEKEAVRLAYLRDMFIDGLAARVPDMVINGAREKRLPNNVNVSFPGVESLELITRLDARGIACSAKSACKTADTERSYVIDALGGMQDADASSVRFSLGLYTRHRDIRTAYTVVPEVLSRTRQAK